jgi:DNA-binding PadR family transcriptional regulator
MIARAVLRILSKADRTKYEITDEKEY